MERDCSRFGGVKPAQRLTQRLTQRLSAGLVVRNLVIKTSAMPMGLPPLWLHLLARSVAPPTDQPLNPSRPFRFDSPSRAVARRNSVHDGLGVNRNVHLVAGDDAAFIERRVPTDAEVLAVDPGGGDEPGGCGVFAPAERAELRATHKMFHLKGERFFKNCGTKPH